jgi:hypothetical protein
MSDPGIYGSDRERMRREFFREPLPQRPDPLYFDRPDYDYVGQVKRVWGPRNGYGCLGFILDCIMLMFTGGLWVIWIFVREMRRAFPRA